MTSAPRPLPLEEANARTEAGLRELVAVYVMQADPDPFDGEITQEVPRVSA